MEEINRNSLKELKEDVAKKKDTVDKTAVLRKTKLETSKVFFSLVSCVYFFSYLFTIAGFEKDISGSIVSIVYPLFIFSVLALLYDVVVTTLNSSKAIKIPLLVILIMFFLAVLAINFGLKI